MRARRPRRLARQLGIYAGLAPFLVIALFRVLGMVITAYKQEQALYPMKSPLWFHLPRTLKPFDLLFTQTWFGAWVVSTALVSVAVVGITFLAALPAAYALARLRLPGANATGTALFMTYLVPPIIVFIPLAPVVGRLGLFDSWWAPVLLYPTFTIPFCTWLMQGFLRTVPRAVGGAAWIDGCSVLGGIGRLVLTLSLPGIATIAIFAFTLSMQEYLYAVVFAVPVDQ